MPEEYDIVVVTSAKRKPLITQYLDGLGAIISVTPDYKINPFFKPKVGGLVQNHLGAWRCFRGHQDAILKSTKDIVLVFEDDAVPNRPDWLVAIHSALSLLKQFDMVSFHGRDFNEACYDRVNDEFIKPKNPGSEWVVAALAYMINKSTINKLTQHEYDGTPWDLFLYRSLNYCLMKNSIFNHDRTEGSLIDHGA